MYDGFDEYPADKERNRSIGYSEVSLIIRRIVTEQSGCESEGCMINITIEDCIYSESINFRKVYVSNNAIFFKCYIC